jgi:subtilisin-like proprotein convertase family protein
MRLSYFHTVLFLLLWSAQTGIAQESRTFWTPVDKNALVLPPNAERLFEPFEYTSYSLEYKALTDWLSRAPVEFSPEATAQKHTVPIPGADGAMELFAVAKTDVMPPGLAARYPQIQTYTGQSLRSPGKNLRITVSPYRGVEIMIRRADKGIEYVEPLAAGQNLYYMAYDRRDYPLRGKATLKVDVDTVVLKQQMEEYRSQLAGMSPKEIKERGALDPVKLRVYKFAASTTGEFSIDNGGTLENVLAKVVATVNKMNSIYEGDLGIRLQLLEQQEKIIFLDPATDPFTGNTTLGWMLQNVNVVNDLVGIANYNLGHVFARDFDGSISGIATLSSCCTINRARGCSAGTKPYGDDFFSVIGQEVGHQWAAGHTLSNCGDNSQYRPESACEPGSGSTIMSYGGICPATDNVQGDADLYYHACSVAEIRLFISTSPGSNCGTLLTTENNAPTAKAPYKDNFFIPIGTPFELTGTGTDPDGDALTYNWDQVDLGDNPYPMGSPVGNTPLFRSFPPTANANRIFPRTFSLLNNLPDKREVLPTYDRDLTFCFVVRDGKPGGIALDTVAFRATKLAGPFKVLSPNGSPAVWQVGEYQIVEWDVAKTDAAPVNCKKVNIKLSTNGGQSFNVLLAEGVPNTGRACIQVPNNVGSMARIRVEAADNVFFDVSNGNFQIKAADQAGFTLCAQDPAIQVCFPAEFKTTISTAALSGFSGPIALSASGLPANAKVVIDPATVQPGQSAALTLSVPSNAAAASVDMVITGTSGDKTATMKTAVVLVSANYAGMGLLTPADGAAGVVQAPILSWKTVADANTYEIQLADSPGFGAASIKASKAGIAGNTYQVPVTLEKNKVYFWRVRPLNNACGNGPWTDPFLFGTEVQSCAVIGSNDLPKTISANSVNTVESKITVNGGGTISDVNVKKIQGNHTFFRDLELRLVGPGGQEVLLFKEKCASFSGVFNCGFDNNAAAVFPCPPPNNGLFFKPVEDLGVFNGLNSAGDWILRVKDNAISSGGKIDVFQLELCSSAALNAPFIVNNKTLSIMPGVNAAINTSLLKTEDADNTAAQLTYTLVTVPQKGSLQKNMGGALAAGAQFTQADLDAGAIRYFALPSNSGLDAFKFLVSDGAGGFATGTFTIQSTVGVFEPAQKLEFDLMPNPADDLATLIFPETLNADTRIALYDVSGRMLRSLQLSKGALTAALDVADLPEGFYVVTVENEKGVGAKKVVIR